MNCGDFRYLIQRRFDVELLPQDDRALLIHLETCDSCQKFYHQVQQVIIAAEELELVEDLLPQKPDDLLSKILENLPKEQAGIKDIILSFMERFGLFRKTEDQTFGESGILPRITSISKRQSTTVADDFAQAAMNWNDSSSAGGFPSGPENIEEPFSTPGEFAEPIDQVITRSLGEKFGISGANNQLIAKQGRSLAESIKQKISEMSKHNVDYQAVSQSPESTTEPPDEWTVPHSPQWPKLNIDTNPEQWPSEIPGTRAPDAWGVNTSNWGNQVQPAETNVSAEFINDTQQWAGQAYEEEPKNYPLNEPAEPATTVEPIAEPIIEPALSESPINKRKTWSSEAEQLETGNWQMVQLDTVLGAKSYSAGPLPPLQSSPVNQYSQPPSPPIPAQAAPPVYFNSESQADTIPPPTSSAPTTPTTPPAPVIVPQESDKSELNTEPAAPQTFSPSPVQQPDAPAGFPLENFPQMFAEEAASTETPSSTEVLPEPPIQQAPPPPFQQQRSTPQVSQAVQSISQSGITAAPRIYPVVSKKAQLEPADPDVISPNKLSEVAKPPEIKPSNVRIPALKLPAAPVPTPPVVPPIELPSNKPAVESEPRLFNFDDGAIDKIFSANLGVHERVVPAQSSTTPPSPSLSEPATNIDTEQFAAAEAVTSIQDPTAFTFSPPVVPAADQAANSMPPNNLLDVDDSMIDRIFKDALGVSEQANKNVANKPKQEPAPQMPIKKGIADISAAILAAESAGSAPPPPPTSPSLPPPDLTLPDISQSILQSQISPLPTLPQPSNIEPSIAAVPESAKTDSPSFGQGPASGYTSGKQKIIGVGKLDNRSENAADIGSGRIASIGKFLLDNKDLEKIGKITALDLADSKMRTLTIEANEELKNLLSQIDAQEGVTGTVIVGHDGLLIANTIPQEMDPESLGVWALGVFMGTAHVVEKLGDDNVRQIVSQTSQGYLIIANFGAGLLVTLTNPIRLDKLLPLMRTITQLVAA